MVRSKPSEWAAEAYRRLRPRQTWDSCFYACPMSLYKGMIAYSVLRLGSSLIRLAIWSVPDVVFGLLGLLIGLMALLCIVNRKVILLQVVYVVMHVDVLITVADLITLSVILSKVNHDKSDPITTEQFMHIVGVVFGLMLVSAHLLVMWCWMSTLKSLHMVKAHGGTGREKVSGSQLKSKRAEVRLLSLQSSSSKGPDMVPVPGHVELFVSNEEPHAI